MPKLPFSLLTLAALTLSMAQAQTLPSNATVGVGTYTVDGSSATVGQTINLSIPKRFGLHLHRNTWTLDLTNLKSDGTVTGDGGDANCWRAGDHSSGLGDAGTGRDVLYSFTPDINAGTLPLNAPQADRDNSMGAFIYATDFKGDQAADSQNPYSYKGFLVPGSSRVASVSGDLENAIVSKLPIGGYPGFYVNSGKLEWKGPIMCTFQTIVQKFSNSTKGWQFTAKVADNSPQKFPFALYMSDFIPGTDASTPIRPSWFGNFPSTVALRTGDAAAKRLARGYDFGAGQGVTSGGWLDDNLLEVIVFDGSVAAGTYGGTVTFALTDYAPPADGNGL